MAVYVRWNVLYIRDTVCSLCCCCLMFLYKLCSVLRVIASFVLSPYCLSDFSCLTLFHFVCFISPLISSSLCLFCIPTKIIPIFCWFLSSLVLLLPSPLLGCHYPSFTLHHLAPSPPLPPHPVVICPFLSFAVSCPVSSDLYKSIQSGSKVALPPHLQLAFSGKMWPPPQSLLHWLPPCTSFLKCLVCFVAGFWFRSVLCSSVSARMPFMYSYLSCKISEMCLLLYHCFFSEL